MTSLIKKTLLGSAVVIGLLLATVFAFGSLDPIRYTIRKESPIPRFEKIPTTATLSKENITEEIAKEIAQELIDKNPEGPGQGEAIGLETIDPNTLTQEALAQAFKQINIDDLRPRITTTDITIIKSSDVRLAQEYFNAIHSVLIKNFPSGVSVNFANPDETNFAALINAYATSMQESLKIPAPEPLANLHREYISLLGAEKNALTLIKNYTTDPAQAAVAIEAGNTFTAELASVFTQMDVYISEHNITLATL